MNQLMKSRARTPVYDRNNSVTGDMNSMYWLQPGDIVCALVQNEYDVITVLSRHGIGYVFPEDLRVL